jgi:RNA polymerase sigma-70 factor (ECF subfamily)
MERRRASRELHVIGAMASESAEPETALVAQARKGDARAFGSLVERHMRRAYFAALGLVGSHEDALDLSQEAFARAFRARRSLDPTKPFYAWLYTILRRLCFNFLRDTGSRRRKLAAASDWLVDAAAARSQEADPERSARAGEIRERVLAALEELPDREREMLVLREFEGLKYREIADLLGVPIGTVMSRLYGARRRLARTVEDLR